MDLERQLSVEFLLHRQCDLRIIQTYLETLDHCLTSECLAVAQDGEVPADLYKFRMQLLLRTHKKMHALYCTLSRHMELRKKLETIPKLKVKTATAK